MTIQFQEGPVKENGVNGCQADDVIGSVLGYLRTVSQPPHANRQTSLAITKLEEAAFWLRDRTEERERRGVEGTNQP
jgi:hypothetical protein